MRRRVVRAWAVLLVASAAVTTTASAQAGPPNRIVAVTSAIEVKEEATVLTTFLVAAGVTRLLVSVDGEAATISSGACPTDPAAFSPFLDVPGATAAGPARADFCVRGVEAGAGRLVALGSDGSSASVAVTVTPKMPALTDASAAAPASLQVVTADAVRRATVDPGFPLSGRMSAVASGPDGTAVAVLAPTSPSCPGTTTTTSGAPTTTTTPPPGPVHLLVCGATSVGTYTAKFDLNGAAAGGDLTVTAIRRHSYWWSIPAVLLGLAVGILVSVLTARAEAAAKEATAERTRQAAEKVFADIVSELGWGGPEMAGMAELWAPQRWEALSHGSTSTSPTPPEAGALYARAAVCVRPLVQLWVHYWRGEGPEPYRGEDVTLASSAKAGLRFGIATTQESETPAKVVDRLERHAALAHVALKEDTRLANEWKIAPEADKPAIAELRRRLASATLDRVDDVLAPIDATVEELGIVQRAVVAQAARSWDTAVVLASPTAGPPPNPARAALHSRTAKTGAVVLGLVAAVVIGMTEALNPTAAWGTAADFVTMFGAAVALPSVADQARKVLAGPAGPAK